MSDLKDFIIEDGVLKKYTGKGGDVVIPKEVTFISKSSFYEGLNYTISSLTVCENVTRIDEWAFRNCFNLKTLHFLCDNVKIASNAFYNTNGISEITLNLDETKAFKAFKNLIAIKELKLPLLVYALKQDKSSLFINECAKQCVTYKDRLMDWIIEHDDILVLNALFSCFKKKLDLEKINGYIKAAEDHPDLLRFLLDYKSLNYTPDEEIVKEERKIEVELGAAERTLSEWKKIFSISEIDEGYEIKKYKADDVEVIIPARIEGKPVVSVGYRAFAENKNIVSVEIPDTVTNIGERAFARCWALETIKIPNGVRSIGTETFDNCSHLTKVVLPEGLISIGIRAFSTCYKLVDINFPKSITYIGTEAFYQCKELKNTPVSDSATLIGDAAFYECENITTAIIPDGIETFSANVFYGCKNLTSLTIPNSVTWIQAPCSFCKNLTIHAPAGSYAEQYAKENNIPFVAE